MSSSAGFDCPRRCTTLVLGTFPPALLRVLFAAAIYRLTILTNYTNGIVRKKYVYCQELKNRLARESDRSSKNIEFKVRSLGIGSTCVVGFMRLST